MTDGTSSAKLSITIKYGDGSSTAARFEGERDSIREEILAYVGMDREAARELTLNAIVVNATQMAHGVGVLADKLGATMLPSPTKTAAPAESEAPPWESAATPEDIGWPSAPAPVPQESPIIGAIKAIGDITALKRFYAENKAEMVGEALDAWKSRGKELTAKAA